MLKQIDLKAICKKHATVYSDGHASVNLYDFAEACYNDNTQDELINALCQEKANKTDCDNWCMTPSAWRCAIERALAALIIEANDDKLPG